MSRTCKGANGAAGTTMAAGRKATAGNARAGAAGNASGGEGAATTGSTGASKFSFASSASATIRLATISPEKVSSETRKCDSVGSSSSTNFFFRYGLGKA